MIDLESSTLVEWLGLIDEATDDYINDATVSGLLKDADGILLGTFDLDYQASSNGTYQGYITPAMVAGVTACDQLTVILTAEKGSFVSVRKWMEEADYRGKI